MTELTISNFPMTIVENDLSYMHLALSCTSYYLSQHPTLVICCPPLYIINEKLICIVRSYRCGISITIFLLSRHIWHLYKWLTSHAADVLLIQSYSRIVERHIFIPTLYKIAENYRRWFTHSTVKTDKDYRR